MKKFIILAILVLSFTVNARAELCSEDFENAYGTTLYLLQTWLASGEGTEDALGVCLNIQSQAKVLSKVTCTLGDGEVLSGKELTKTCTQFLNLLKSAPKKKEVTPSYLLTLLQSSSA